MDALLIKIVITIKIQGVGVSGHWTGNYNGTNKCINIDICNLDNYLDPVLGTFFSACKLFSGPFSNLAALIIATLLAYI